MAALAGEIWYEYYVPLIGKAQVDYMVEQFQSASAIAQQIAAGLHYHMMMYQGVGSGYFALKVEPDATFISKLYILAHLRRAGLGREALNFIERWSLERGLKRLWLTVNKANPSVRAYERLGFTVVEPVVIDIGGGFVMDDFRMEKALT